MSWLRKFLWYNFFLTIFWFCKSLNSLPSTIDVDEFLQTESAMISKGRNYLSKERERIKILKKHLKEWKKWQKSYSNQENEYITVPQNIFHLFKKLTLDLDQIEKIMTENSYNDTMISDDIKPPTEDHLKQVVLSLIDTQYFYDLKPNDIMNGTLKDIQLNTTLDLDSCYFIGKTCSEFNKHACVTDWLNTCLSLTPEEDEARRKDVQKLLYPSYTFLNDTNHAILCASKHLKENPFDIPARDTVLYLEHQTKKLSGVNLNYIETNRLCRGEYNTTLSTLSNLRCRYVHENSPFLKLAPLKEEELYDDPKILLYQDVIYDSEIEGMKAWAVENLKVATVVGKDGRGGYKAFNYRISETGFMNNRSPQFSKLTKRIEDISQMSISTGEMWQLLSYTPGGYYAMHSDYLPNNAPDVEQYGNRVASMLFYFNDVILGGQTVFTRLKLSVSPKKGSAIIWFNVHPDLSQNFQVDHSACPVVIGEKWGFTQWFRSKNQITLRRIFEKNLPASAKSNVKKILTR